MKKSLRRQTSTRHNQLNNQPQLTPDPRRPVQLASERLPFMSESALSCAPWCICAFDPGIVAASKYCRLVAVIRVGPR